MAELINLRRARKSRARADNEAAAAANRAKHGRSKTEKQTERAGAELAERAHEGHKLSPSGEPSGSGLRPARGQAAARPEDPEVAGSRLDSRVSLRSPENDG